MGVYISDYGGDLKTMILSDFIRKGKGDDFVASMDEPVNRNFGTLAIKLNSDDYSRAIKALNGDYGKAMLVGVEDTMSGSPYIFVRRIRFGDKYHMFPVIFNAKLCEPAADGDYSGLEVESFRLQLGRDIDPERHCQIRIIYAPGERIEWSEEEQEMVFASLSEN